MQPATQQNTPKGNYLLLLSLTSLGVVYGDIGTSVLYSLRECFSGPHAIPVTRPNVLGVLSLVVWSLLLIVSTKYLAFVMRADNRGEGGILALSSIIASLPKKKKGSFRGPVLLGVFGSALLYGDGMITPAISVLSAVEGLQVATPFFKPYAVPITVAILAGLFLFQRRGTEKIGAIFGPIMLCWFTCLAVLGISNIARDFSVLSALNPWHAFLFFQDNGWRGFLTLGSVFLVITGGEALYADMGNFGRRPIHVAWFSVVLPGLILNYFGQGALLLTEADAAANPFFRMAPGWALYPLVGLATIAAVIASQALITGAYSLTMQAIQLQFAPRMEIRHTSSQEFGQVYMPFVNYTLMFASIGLVIEFRSAGNLAAAYGIAITGTMVITTVLFTIVARQSWKWSWFSVAVFSAFFLTIDVGFLSANLLKIPNGGWFPILVGLLIMMSMMVWNKGVVILEKKLHAECMPLSAFTASVTAERPTRVKGTAVFMSSNREMTPSALLRSLRHYHVLHERNVLLAVVAEGRPRVDEAERVQVERLSPGFFRITLRYGFAQVPDVPAALGKLKSPDLTFDPAEVTYFLGRETIVASDLPAMGRWRARLFAAMTRNAHPATAYFKLPPNRVVELGAQVTV